MGSERERERQTDRQTHTHTHTHESEGPVEKFFLMAQGEVATDLLSLSLLVLYFLVSECPVEKQRFSPARFCASFWGGTHVWYVIRTQQVAAVITGG